MRLLIIGDFADTGFGRVGKELMRRFLAAGVDVRALAVNWRGKEAELMAFLQRRPTNEQVAAWLEAFDAEPMHSRMVPASVYGDGMGYNVTAQALTGDLFSDKWKPEGAIIVADPRAMSQRLSAAPNELRALPVWNYVPIEGVNLPPCWRDLWSHITPVAMSEFGRNELQTLLHRPVASVPHGVSEAFFPVSPNRPGYFNGSIFRNREECKTAFGMEGDFVFLRTDRLVPRKNYPALFRIMAPVLQGTPERQLVVHCAPVDEGGVMAEFISHVPGSFDVNMIWRHPQIRFTGGHDTFHGFPDEQLNILYNAADVLVSPTKAEGFGLTLAEAAATGVPVVTTDYAAGPEAVGKGAVLISPATYHTSESSIDWALVDEPAFTSAVERLASDPAERARIGALGIAHTKTLTWDATASQFLSLLG